MSEFLQSLARTHMRCFVPQIRPVIIPQHVGCFEKFVRRVYVAFTHNQLWLFLHIAPVLQILIYSTPMNNLILMQTNAELQMASLSSVLSTATRPRIPLGTLNAVGETDRVVVENVVNVAHDLSCYLRIEETSIEINTNTYRVVIPFSDKRCSMSYRDMQKLMSYNPSRIDDMRLTISSEGRLLFVICITDEKTPYDVSEYDILRVQKRRRVSS